MVNFKLNQEIERVRDAEQNHERDKKRRKRGESLDENSLVKEGNHQ